MLSRSPDEPKRTIKYVLDIGSILAQLIGLFIWPLTITSARNIWFIPLSIFFVSFRWWENYVTKCSPICETLIYNFDDDLLTSFHFKIQFNISPTSRTIFMNHVIRFIFLFRLTKSFSSSSAARFYRKTNSSNSSRAFQVALAIIRYESKK